MTDRHGIGRKMEQEAMRVLWNDGLHAFWQPPRGKFASQDIWGMFDFICLSATGRVVAVQVCLDRPCWVLPRLKAIREWIAAQKPDMDTMVVAYKRNYDGFVSWRTV